MAGLRLLPQAKYNAPARRLQANPLAVCVKRRETVVKWLDLPLPIAATGRIGKSPLKGFNKEGQL